MSAIDSSPPTWSVDDLYPTLDTPPFTDDLQRLETMADGLDLVFEEHAIGPIAPRPPTQADAIAAAQVIDRMNVSGDLGRTLYAVVDSHLRVGTSAELASSAMGRIAMLMGRSRAQNARLAAWLAALGVDRLAALSQLVAAHDGPLGNLAARVAHQMSSAEETLHAELSATGPAAWTQLHGAITSQLTADVHLPSGSVRRSMGEIRGLATDPDRATRRAAYDAELVAWPTVAVPCAAALNAIKGDANCVNRRRGWASALDAALFSNRVDRAAYDAMDAAIAASLPHLRRFARVKARLHGHSGGLPWFDLVAPLPQAPAVWSWAEGLALVRSAFARYGDELVAILDRAVAGRWIDAAPRPGKAPGASSIPLVGDRSLVMVNFTGALEQVITLAHELGHAFHNAQLSRRTALCRDVPMSLAETASIFCETLFVHTGLERADDVERLALLDVDLAGAFQTIADIRTRIVFETALFERRRTRTLGPGELCEMMREAQREVFDGSVTDDSLHPYMWAVKRHYYTSHFYNWQYTFGLLFGLGLFARFLEDPLSFRASYAEVLSLAGSEPASDLARRFDIDLADEGFWRSSLAVVVGRIDTYERLAGGLGT